MNKSQTPLTPRKKITDQFSDQEFHIDDGIDDLVKSDSLNHSQEPVLSIEAALNDSNHFAIFPIQHISNEEIVEFLSTTLWCPTKKNNDFIAQSTEMLKTDLVKKVMEQIRERIPSGYELFSFFARLYHEESYVKPHQDQPSFDWRFIVRLATSPTAATVGFHSSKSGPEIYTKTIPINHGYLASRTVLSKHGVGLYHSITPAIGSKDLQTSLIFDVHKNKPNVDSTVFKFLDDIPPDCETKPVGGRNVYVDPARRISSLASALGRIGNKMQTKEQKAAAGRKGTKEQKAAAGRIGGKSQNNRTHKEGIWHAAHCDSLDCVEKTVEGKGKLGRSKEKGRPSEHRYNSDGKRPICGYYRDRE